MIYHFTPAWRDDLAGRIAAFPRTKPWLIGGFYLALGAGLEITQIFGIVSGTFQVKDLFANVAGVLAALAPLALAKRKAR